MPSLAHRRDVARGRPGRLLVPCAAQEARTRVWNRILAACGRAARVDNIRDEEQQDAAGEPARAQVPSPLPIRRSDGNESA